MKSKFGKIAVTGALACALVCATPVFAGCSNGNSGDSKNEQQQENLINPVGSQFVLAAAGVLALPLHDSSEAEEVISSVQGSVQIMLKMVEAKTIKIGEVYEVSLKHESSSLTTSIYRIKLEVNENEYVISRVLIGVKNERGQAEDIGSNSNNIINSYSISYDGVVSKVSIAEYQGGDAVAFIRTTTIATDGSYSYNYVDMTASQESSSAALLSELKGNVASDNKISIID